VKILGRMSIFPPIPARIGRLYELAYNLWWSWHPEAQALYRDIDRDLWEYVGHNPVRFLSEISSPRLERAATDDAYCGRYDATLAAFDTYMHAEDTWFRRTYPQYAGRTIAYFSAEFGLHEALPIYSGGLGILSGDHCKEASDLGLPFVGVGFLYPQGYFTQRITRDGHQEAIYDRLHFAEAPATAATDPDGNEVLIGVDLPGRRVYAKVWKLQVGRIPLYLLDTDVDFNSPADRVLAARLYGGDIDMRIAQEIMLGIGGVRALRALHIDPAVWHMNEGHSAFMGLERARELIAEHGLSFAEAREVVVANAIFTTHTPVAAGNDAFGFDLIDRYFGNYWPQLGLSRDEFLLLAYQEQSWGSSFSMTALALRLSGQSNGVSRIHGEVSRRMWSFLWPGVDIDEVPITHITNGVHTATWLAPEMAALYDRSLGEQWRTQVDDPAVWEPVARIPDAELWAAHQECKRQLFAYARRHLRQQRIRLGEGPQQLDEVETMLDPDRLTIGFARRFATYKRATLLFRDLARLRALLTNPERPVQIIFAGKAHPADEPGKALISQIVRLAQEEGFRGHILFLEGYDMEMARYLVSGCDLWLNTPIHPYEASGTSGQKASLNGLPNCSVLDGWWVEGFNGRNGWSIGEGREYYDAETRDAADSRSLYSVLEQQVLPAYYERDEQGVPRAWISVMKEAIRTIVPRFSMSRMVKEYTDRCYIPAAQQAVWFEEQAYALPRALAVWKQHVMRAWPQLQVRATGPRNGQLGLGEPIAVEARVSLGALQPDDIAVEVVYGRDDRGVIVDTASVAMSQDGVDGDGTAIYRARLAPETNGLLVYGVRVRPTHPALPNRYALGLVRWA
jgi:starch phosphorylase